VGATTPSVGKHQGAPDGRPLVTRWLLGRRRCGRRPGHGRGAFLGLVHDDRLGGEEQRRDRGRVLQRRAGHLDGVDDARREQVLVLAGGGVEALGRLLQVADLLHHDATFEAGVHGDLLQRLLDGPGHHAAPRGLVALELLGTVEDLGLGPQQGHPASGHHALLDGGLGGRDGVLDAVLLLFELDLGGRTHLDDRHTARQLGQALLELLAVVVGVGVLDLGLDLVDPALDLGVVAGAFHDRRLVLGNDDLAGPAEHVEPHVLELEADLFGDDLAAG
jgi:hypothetical protein